MKTSASSIAKRILLAVTGGIALLSLVSWSPPDAENIVFRNGIIDLYTNAAVSNEYGVTPSVILGNTNDLLKNGASLELGRGLVIGNTNGFSAAGGYGAVIGTSNNVWGFSTLVVGNTNNVSGSATSWQQSTRYSIISGNSNVISNDCQGLLAGGTSNTIQANNSLVTGYGNTVGGAAIGTAANSSFAIGLINSINANYGWTMGYSNTVTGNYGAAIGSGLLTANAYSTALGKFNAPMQSGDVLVIGTGTAATARSTALTVTEDGGVILGRAQGDISMGIYGN